MIIFSHHKLHPLLYFFTLDLYIPSLILVATVFVVTILLFVMVFNHNRLLSLFQLHEKPLFVAFIKDRGQRVLERVQGYLRSSHGTYFFYNGRYFHDNLVIKNLAIKDHPPPPALLNIFIISLTKKNNSKRQFLHLSVTFKNCVVPRVNF